MMVMMVDDHDNGCDNNHDSCDRNNYKENSGHGNDRFWDILGYDKLNLLRYLICLINEYLI